MKHNKVTKKAFLIYVSRKLGHTLHYYHVLGVMTILFEEMLKDLKARKDIQIANFGTLKLSQSRPRLRYDVKKQAVAKSGWNRLLKFTLSPVIHRKIRQFASIIDNYLGGD